MNPAHAQMAHDAMLDEPGAATGPARVRRGIRPIPRITVQAFCETHELQSAIETAREDRRLARVHIKVQAGGLPAAVEFYRDAPTPNLVILETTERREGLLRDLQAFSDVCDPTTRVAIVGHVNDILLYRELTQLGIADYAVVPIAPSTSSRSFPTSMLIRPPSRLAATSPLSAPRGVWAPRRLPTTSLNASPTR